MSVLATSAGSGTCSARVRAPAQVAMRLLLPLLLASVTVRGAKDLAMNGTIAFESTPPAAGGRAAKDVVAIAPDATPSEAFAAAQLAALLGPSRAKSASRSLRRALLLPQTNPGSLYRRAKRA